MYTQSLHETHSLSLLATHNAVPGAQLKGLPWHKQALLALRTGSTRSTRPGALLAPLREIAAHTYVELNSALAQCVSLLPLDGCHL